MPGITPPGAAGAVRGISPQGVSYATMAQYLAAKTGLAYSVALAWLEAEGSVIKGNPLGLTDGHGHFLTFSSWQAGLDATAAELETSSYYRGIMAAIHSGAGAAAQRAAIIASPWDKGNYRNGAGFPAVAGGSAGPAQPQGGLLAGVPILNVLTGAGDVFPIPAGQVSDANACPTGYQRAQIDPQLNGLFGTNYVPLDQLGPNDANACVKVGIGTGSVTGQELAGAVQSGVGGLGSLLVDGFILAAVLGLGYLGIRELIPAQAPAD